MSSTTPRLINTGATGQLGRVVIANIVERKPGADVTAMVRNVASATDLADLGVDVVPGDYKEPASPEAAFDRALFAKNMEPRPLLDLQQIEIPGSLTIFCRRDGASLRSHPTGTFSSPLVVWRLLTLRHVETMLRKLRHAVRLENTRNNNTTSQTFHSKETI